ncbi:MAG: TIGR04255 family protein [Caulobacteraceae bacterium]|jgi:uncharacterized protein (TIGR04255 family)
MTDYPHPPLFEAVIELRYAGDGSQRAFEQAAKRIHKLYPVAQDIRAKVLAAEGVPSDAPEVVFLARHLSSADGADTVILHPDRVALSRKAPYLGWDDFTRRMREVLATAAPISKRRGLSRVGVRYIDRLDVPVASDVVFDYQEFVRVAANPLPFESGPVSGISLSAATIVEGGKFGVVLNFGMGQSPLPGRAGLMLDTEVFNQIQSTLPKTESELWSQLSEMRDWKNRIFEASITDKARALFN